MMLRLCSVVLLVIFNCSDLAAQAFRPRGQGPQSMQSAQPVPSSIGATNQLRTPTRPSVNDSAQQHSGTVSRDLLQIYSQTQSVRLEADVANIAKLSAQIVADSNRTSADRDYAASLLAWALNRRGEMRSEQAAAMVQAGQLDAAERLDAQAADDFAKAVKYAPSKWRHRHNYAISLAMRGDYPAAINQATQAIELNPEYANARYNRAELYFEMGDLEAAELDYTAALELVQDAQYYNSRAHCRFLRQAYPLAVADYRQAGQLDATNANYQADLGDAYQFLGRWEEAAKAYRDAVAVDNRSVRAYQNASWLMATCPDEKLRNTDLALAAAQRALELSGERTAEVVETMAAATAAAGKFQEAAKLQEEAIRLANQSQSLSPDQIDDMAQRLSLYDRNQAYLQPQTAVSRTPAVVTRTASAVSDQPSVD